MKKTIYITLLVAFLGACGSDDSNTNTSNTNNQTTEETPESEACEHLAEGPFQAVTATADAMGTLENAAYEHTRVNIALADIEGGKGGFTSFEADGDGDFYFFLSADLPLKILDGSGAEVAMESTTIGSDLCTEIGAIHVVELMVGTYTLEFGPTTETEVGLAHELVGAEQVN
jgi:hypothetical protein